MDFDGLSITSLQVKFIALLHYVAITVSGLSMYVNYLTIFSFDTFKSERMIM